MRKKAMMLQMSKKNLMNFMKSLYSSVECCRHDENDLSKHGFEGHTSGKQT